MIIRDITLRNFRNHAASTLTFHDGINALLGENGQGKTNVLEAISYLSLTKSFFAASDLHVLRMGEQVFDVEGHMIADGGMPSTVRVAYRREPAEKVVTINNVRPESLSSVIGRFPVVVLSPEHASITAGGPAERRRFLDLTLSQVSSVYLDDVMEYRRTLRQRNKLLADIRFGQPGSVSLLEPWTVNLARYGGSITARRLQFVQEFAAYVERAYGSLVEVSERPQIEYTPFTHLIPGMAPEEVSELMLAELRKRAAEEERRGTSLVGPHRDDLQFSLNGMSVQRYASQGQHKTLLVALKVAEYFYMQERRNETPIMLLDDLFSELDEQRSRRILQAVETMGQAIVTTTEESVFHDAIRWNDHHRRFIIEHGTVRTTEDGTSGKSGGGAGETGEVARDRESA